VAGASHWRVPFVGEKIKDPLKRIAAGGIDPAVPIQVHRDELPEAGGRSLHDLDRIKGSIAPAIGENELPLQAGDQPVHVPVPIQIRRGQSLGILIQIPPGARSGLSQGDGGMIHQH
jgi:hypothetical protein